MSWNEAWDVDPSAKPKAGGQGEVRKVVRRCDGVVGALKQLHADNQAKQERRFRAHTETLALVALEGKGVPKLLDSNTEKWNDKGVSLHAVVEWVDGKALSDFVNGNPLSLDVALHIGQSLCETLARCHALKVHHRDVKPDNIMVRSVPNGGGFEPVLVDFGMAWVEPDEGEELAIKTQQGQEIGNRFLRLPEYAPGQHRHDERSDVTLLVGLVFYMMTAVQPRILRDSNGKMPHVFLANHIPQSVKGDRRWDRLVRAFNIGFQEKPDDRFQSAAAFRERLLNLEPIVVANADELLQQEIERYSQVVQSSTERETTHLRNTITRACARYSDMLLKLSHRAKVAVGASGPTLSSDGKAMEATNEVIHDIALGPRATAAHRVEFQGGEFIGSIRIDEDQFHEYFRGQVGDIDSFFEAVEQEATKSLALMLRKLSDKVVNKV